MKNVTINDFINEESYKDLFDNAHDLIQIVDLEGRVLYANKSWTETLGFELEEIQGQPIISFIDLDDRDKYLEYRSQIVNEEVYHKEVIIRFHTKNKRRVDLEGFVSLRKLDGKPLYTRGIFRNITAKLENEAQLREREYNLQQLLHNAPDAIIVINAESVITYWNPQAEKLFGWTVNEAINQPLSHMIIPVQYRELHDNGMKRFLATGEAHVLNNTIEITAINKSGDEFFVSLTISTTTQNGTAAFIAFIRDIREQKKNEIELENKRRELELSNQQLEQFAHVASHDMKEPIRKILVFSERLAQELKKIGVTDKAADYLGKVQTSAQRLLSMVEGVLDYATTSGIEMNFENIDLNTTIKNITTDLEVLIEKKTAIIKYGDLPTINGVEFLIYQLFYNLINNSLKFSKEDVPPLIEISSREVNSSEVDSILPANADGYINIRLKDNGIGFKQEFASKIFNTFTRLNSRAQYEGTGLGLTLCQNIMERHHGYIRAEAEENRGATFNLYFKKVKYSTAVGV